MLNKLKKRINNLKERINERKRPLTDEEILNYAGSLTKEEKQMYARLYRGIWPKRLSPNKGSFFLFCFSFHAYFTPPIMKGVVNVDKQIKKVVKVCVIGGILYGTVELGYVLGKGTMLGILRKHNLSADDVLTIIGPNTNRKRTITEKIIHSVSTMIKKES